MLFNFHCGPEIVCMHLCVFVFAQYPNRLRAADSSEWRLLRWWCAARCDTSKYTITLASWGVEFKWRAHTIFENRIIHNQPTKKLLRWKIIIISCTDTEDIGIEKVASRVQQQHDKRCYTSLHTIPIRIKFTFSGIIFIYHIRCHNVTGYTTDYTHITIARRQSTFQRLLKLLCRFLSVVQINELFQNFIERFYI